MPNCCVFGCNRSGGIRFPSDPTLRKQWIHAVRRKNWVPTKYSVVCHSHFKPSEYITEGYYSGVQSTRKLLKPGVVPTVFTWLKSKPHGEERRLRLERRSTQPQPTTLEPVLEQTEDVILQPFPDHCDVHEEIIDAATIILPSSNSSAEVGCQTVTEGPRFSISAFITNSKALHFYTGLENYAKFTLVLQTLGPAADQLNYLKNQVLNISVEDQFFLTLIKLRLNKQIFELSLMFEISEATVSNIFNTWVTFMALQWAELDIWPSQELVQYYMPKDFKRKFPNTRVIMDGTEFPINKPTEPNVQQVTFSTYKNRNTLKVLVGVTPGGLISYCSDAYGGSASDRQIVERSQFVSMCDRGDTIMADRGFNVQDLFAPKDISINIPAFLKGKNQLPGLTVVHDRKIASKRVHVERIIGMTKTYKILKHELNTHFVHLGTKIYFVSAMLCNFRESIVGRNA